MSKSEIYTLDLNVRDEGDDAKAAAAAAVVESLRRFDR